MTTSTVGHSLSADTTVSTALRGRKWTHWSAEETSSFGVRPFVAKHRLLESALFSDAAILDLIEGYPRDRIQIFTMGADASNKDEWQPVALGKTSSTDLWQAIAGGRLWCKLLQLPAVDKRFRDLLDELYGELADQCPGFSPVRTYGTLLIASPRAQVYYHADPQPNLLWHLRGSKRVWVYPAGDRELIDQDLMEDIFASFVDEEAPYKTTFDKKAMVFDLHAGEVISWPQNSPHRIVNQRDINVSLSTLHETEESDRRKLIYCANRLLRRRYGLPARSVDETGLAAYSKRMVYRTFRHFGLVEVPKRRVYLTDLQVDPGGDDGVRAVADGPVLTEFSNKEFKLERDGKGNLTAVPMDQS